MPSEKINASVVDSHTSLVGTNGRRTTHGFTSIQMFDKVLIAHHFIG
jgi:hypothetical protein